MSESHGFLVIANDRCLSAQLAGIFWKRAQAKSIS